MENPSLSAAELLEQADSAFQDRDHSKAFELYRQSLEYARSEFNRPVEVEALSQLARTCLSAGDPGEGRKYLDEAASKADQSDPLGWSRLLGVRGRFEWRSGDLSAARKTFDELYTFCALQGLHGRAIDAANMNAIVAESPEAAIQWSRRGIEMAESYEAEHWLGPLWNNLGGTYYDLKQFDTALECYRNAREYHWQYSAETAKLFADYHVGMCYRLTGQNDVAASWLRPVLAWAQRLGNHSAIAQAADDLGEIERANGNAKTALDYLTLALEHYRLAGYEHNSPEIWTSISERVKQLTTGQ